MLLPPAHIRLKGPSAKLGGILRPLSMARRHTIGDVAQLEERCVRIAEVRGSSPLISTTPLEVSDAAFCGYFGLDVDYPK